MQSQPPTSVERTSVQIQHDLVASELQQSWSKAQQSPPPWCRRSAVWSRTPRTMPKENSLEGSSSAMVRGRHMKSSKRCSTFSVRRSARPSPISAVLAVDRPEIGLTLFELYGAAVVVRKLSSQVTDWQFKDQQLSDAGSQSQKKMADRSRPAQRQTLHNID